MTGTNSNRHSVRLQSALLIGIYLLALLTLVGRALQVPLTVITEPYLAMGAYLVVVISCLICMVIFSMERGRRSSP